MRTTVFPLIALLVTPIFASKPAIYGIDYTTRLGGLDVISLRTGFTTVGINTSESALEAGYAAQCAEIFSAVGMAQIQTDINNLTASVTAVQSLFSTISQELLVIDQLNLSPTRLSPSWGVISAQWTAIIKKSRVTAANVVAYSNNFTENIVPNGHRAGLQNATQLLQEYMDQADTLESAAMDTANAFSTLQFNIASFVGAFQAFAKQAKAIDDAAIEVLESDVTNLNKTIQSLDTEIAGIAQEIGATVLKSVTIVGLFSFFAPIVIIAGLVAIGIDEHEMDSLKDDKQADQNEITMDEISIETLSEQDVIITHVNETITNLKSLSLDSTFRLGAFDSIWAAVKDDCRQISDWLSPDKPSALPQPLALWSAVNHVDCYYEALSGALLLYLSNTGGTTGVLTLKQASLLKTLSQG